MGRRGGGARLLEGARAVPRAWRRTAPASGDVGTDRGEHRASRAPEDTGADPRRAQAREEAEEPACSGWPPTPSSAGPRSCSGRRPSARRHFRLAESARRSWPAPTAVAAFGMDMGIFARIWATHLTWHEGYPERARARADETMDAGCSTSVTRLRGRSPWRTPRCSASFCETSRRSIG